MNEAPEQEVQQESTGEDRGDEELEDAVQRLREEREEFREKYLRKVADFDNLRKRKEQEIREQQKYAHRDLLEDLLEVVDNFERALESMDFENEDVREGSEMIYRQLHDLLSRYDVEPVEAEGEPFDPHQHEGMMQEEVEGLERPVVLDVFKPGYRYHDRVLRPARVRVGVPPSDTDPETSGEDETPAPEEE